METSGWVWYREADDTHARDDNARFRAVLGHCPTCIAVLDEDGHLVGYNQEFKALFSAPPLIGGSVSHLFDERPRAMLAEVVALAGSRQCAGAIISMHTSAGEEREFEFLVATLPGDGLRTIGVVMAAGDRTERSHEEGERALLARNVAEANCHGAINLAQSAMGHDINNVLAALTLTLASLRERCGTADSETCTMLRELDEAVKLGGEIVRARGSAHGVPSSAARPRTCASACNARRTWSHRSLAAPELPSRYTS